MLNVQARAQQRQCYTTTSLGMTLARIQAASIKRAVPDAEAATSDAAQATTDPASTLQHGIAIV
jgi:hypothetical protein